MCVSRVRLAWLRTASRRTSASDAAEEAPLRGRIFAVAPDSDWGLETARRAVRMSFFAEPNSHHSSEIISLERIALTIPLSSKAPFSWWEPILVVC